MQRTTPRDMGSPRAWGHSAGVELVARLRLTHEAPIDLARVPRILGSQEAPWLGEPAETTGHGLRSFLCDLELHAGGSGPTLFRKAAVVSFGEPRRVDEGWVVPVEWRAASLTALFPVLAGWLAIESGQIRLDGRYAPPGGRIGYMLDATLLRAAARQTGRWFMRRLADALA